MESCVLLEEGRYAPCFLKKVPQNVSKTKKYPG
jgi:hypothetical protein